jgi:hypothetical protein
VIVKFKLKTKGHLLHNGCYLTMHPQYLALTQVIPRHFFLWNKKQDILNPYIYDISVYTILIVQHIAYVSEFSVDCE